MRLFLLTAVTMAAFAANSVLNKIGVTDGGMQPFGFAVVRVASGALMLFILLLLRDRSFALLAAFTATGTTSLVVYLIGFSVAYLTLDAGMGALILFGVVQMTMFGAALRAGDNIPVTRWAGATVAFGGLAYLLWPSGADAPDLLGATLMVAAGIGWGIYTLAGRGARDPIGLTATNFASAAAVLVCVQIFIGLPEANMIGVLSAIISGAITSAMGYALWYTILPKLETTIAATAQLTVPVIALGGGVVFLGEALTVRFVIASVLVLGGVAVSLRKR